WGVDQIFIDGGGGGVVDSPLIIWVAQVPQMPDRQPNTSASPTASASSSDVPLSRDHATVIAGFREPPRHEPIAICPIRPAAVGLTSGLTPSRNRTTRKFIRSRRTPMPVNPS